MIQKDKKLLLKDLCARLPYDVKVAFQVGNNIPDIRIFTGKDYDYLKYYHFIDEFTNCTFKPYLRPMSSMTEEERKEYEGFIIHREHVNAQGQEWDIDCFSFDGVPRLIDWLNAHHFDYRGLIPIGLALEAPKEMYKEAEK